MLQTSTFFRSSGDVLADRRYGIARDFLARGDEAAAADLFRQAAEMAPGFAAAWFALGELQDKAGDHDGAVASFRQAHAADPSDMQGAALRLTRLGAGQAGMTPDYVRAVFDQYAPRFDQALDALGYRAPELLHEAIGIACRDAGLPLKFRAMLDLGCGTGLAGAIFRPCVTRLDGVDLSPGMIGQAAQKQLYDHLVAQDIVVCLEDAQRQGHRYDLIIAADVFVYLADIAPVIEASARVLDPDGLFAFTVETHAGDGIVLGEKLRYAHGEAYLRNVMQSAALEIVALSTVSSRTEAGVPVPGLLVVARHAA